MNIGDAILFNATMLHRGRFEIKSKSRKCIQIFEIYKNIDDLKRYYKKILTIPDTNEYYLLPFTQTWFNIPIFKSYINIKTEQIFIKKIKNNEDIFEYISTESQRARAYKDIDKGNLYRLLIKTIDSKNPIDVYNKYIKYPLIDGILYDIIMIFILITFIRIIYNYLNGDSLSWIIPLQFNMQQS